MSIQLSHHVPCENSAVNWIRTGYEEVVAHRTSELFACPAQADGVVVAVDEALKLVKVQYVDQPKPVVGDFAFARHEREAQAELDRGQPAMVLRLPAQPPLVVGGTYRYGQRNLRVAEILQVRDPKQIPGFASLPAAVAASYTRYLAEHPDAALEYVRLEPDVVMVSGGIDVFQFGHKHTDVSGSVIGQTITLNVKVGDRVKRGDIIAYNSGFFQPDPDSRQVLWKHGVMATVALIELPLTLEDSCTVSQELSQQLTTSHGHTRQVVMKGGTVVHAMVGVGDHVETTDYLCVLEDSELDVLSLSDDPETVEFLNELNRKAPKARYHGKIAQIDVYHSCEISAMHPSLAKIVTAIQAHKAEVARAAGDTLKTDLFPMPSKLPVGTKYRGVEFEADTVLFLITVSETIDIAKGDKLCVMSANKTIVGGVMDQPVTTESGLTVDMLFSARSVQNRIVNSPMIVGIGNRCLLEDTRQLTDAYFA